MEEEENDNVDPLIRDLPDDISFFIFAGYDFRRSKQYKICICNMLAQMMLETETVHATANRLFHSDDYPSYAVFFADARVAYCELLGFELTDINSFSKQLLEIQVDEDLELLRSKLSPIKEAYDKIIEVMIDGEKGFDTVHRCPEIADLIEELQTTLGCELQSLLALKKRDFKVQRDSLIKLNKDIAWF